MPNIGAPELIIILVIALLILGPGKLPEVGASIGKSIREFRKASSDVQDTMNVDTSPLPPTPAAPVAPAAPAVDAAPVVPAATSESAAAAAPVAASVAAPAASEPTTGSN
jgi:TatA/E family protein of Tat protein translocase